MKKFFMAVMAVILMGFGGQAFAEFPASGKYIVADGVGTELAISSVNENGATVEIPVFHSQVEKEGVNPKDFTIYGSISYWNGNTWVLIPQEKDEQYAMDTTVVGNTLKANVVFPDAKDSDYMWVRFWGSNGSDWLWIGQGSKFMRLDKNGKPGYEVLFNRKTGEYQAAKNYDVRP